MLGQYLFYYYFLKDNCNLTVTITVQTTVYGSTIIAKLKFSLLSLNNN